MALIKPPGIKNRDLLELEALENDKEGSDRPFKNGGEGHIGQNIRILQKFSRLARLLLPEGLDLRRVQLLDQPLVDADDQLPLRWADGRARSLRAIR